MKKNHLYMNRYVVAIVIIVVGMWVVAQDVGAQAVAEEVVSFRSGDVTLHGTVLVPERSGPGPAIVLVHGAGLGRREEYRAVGEAFAREGILAFIYDKRTEGYSAEAIGVRSYSLLAGDVVAAVEMLQQRDDVDPAQVGLWGLSEGGWVAPLAATRSDEVAFVITVAGRGIGPAEQTAWATEDALRRRGITSEGSLRALTERAYRFVVATGLFPEGTYDPVPVIERLRQPVLALWGALDKTMPPGASARLMHEALERSGNPHYVLRLIPGASHDAYAVIDGQTTIGDFAPGYVQTMITWIQDVLAGDLPTVSVDALPVNEHLTRPSVLDLRGFARWPVQLAFFAAFQVAFGGYFVVGGVRRLRGASSQPISRRWLGRTVALLGLIASWGVYSYVGYITVTAGETVSTVIAGRPLGWFVLQSLAVALLVTAIVLGASWYRERSAWGLERLRHRLLLVGAVLFVPWALWWQLFSL